MEKLLIGGMALALCAVPATEQSYSKQSVSASVGEIASIIEHTAVSSEHSVESCQQFASLANELTCLAGAFKVGQAKPGTATA
jgi:hypothetical protein